MGFEGAQNAVPADESNNEATLLNNPGEIEEIEAKIAEARKSADHWRAEGNIKNAEWNEERLAKFEDELDFLKAVDRGEVTLPSKKNNLE